MKKMIGILLVGVMLPLLPLQAEKGEEEYFITLKQPVKGMKYSIYLDEKCEIPYMREEEEEQAVLESDEDGKIPIPYTEEMTLYLKQSETVRGYFMDPEVYEVNEELQTLDVFPIKVDMECQDCSEKVFDVYEEDNEEVLFQANFETEENCNRFEAGQKYLLKKVKQEEWTVCSDIKVKIPLYPETIVLKPDVITYGKLDIQFTSSNKLENGKFGLFYDQKGTEPVKDINGKDTIINLSEQNQISLSLKKGKLYLKELEVPSGYYRQKEATEILVSEKKVTEVKTELHFSEWNCLIADSENGKELNGKITVTDENGNREEVSAGARIPLFPGKFYTFETSETEEGYYFSTPVNLQIPEYEPEKEEVSLTCDSFLVKVNVKDEDTGRKLNGGRFVIYDEDGNQLQEFTADENDAVLNKLKAGRTYRLHQIRLLDSFLPSSDESIEIPERGTPFIEKTMKMKGYTTLETGITDEDTGRVTNIGEVSVYKDAACTEEVTDVINQERITAEGIKEIHLTDGTYYLKMSSVSDEWYWNNSIMTMNVYHEQSNRAAYTISTSRVDMAFYVKDSEGNNLDQFEVLIMDEDNQKLGILNLFEKNSLKESGIFLTSGRQYYSQLHHKKGKYVYEEEKQPFVISKYNQKQYVQNIAVPYVSLSVLSADPSSEAEYAFYSDEKCTKKAENVKKAKDRWNLKDGVYWLAQEKIHGSFYALEKAEKITVDHHEGWEKAIVKEEIPVTYMIRNVDEENRLLSGSTFEIYDENENMMDRFHTYREEVVLSGRWLKAGETYTLREIMSPDGYQKCVDMCFTVPLHDTGKIPVTTIEHTKKKIIFLPSITERKENKQSVQKADSSTKEKKVQKSEPEKQQKSYAWVFVVALIAGITVAVQKKGNR